MKRRQPYPHITSNVTTTDQPSLTREQAAKVTVQPPQYFASQLPTAPQQIIHLLANILVAIRGLDKRLQFFEEEYRNGKR